MKELQAEAEKVFKKHDFFMIFFGKFSVLGFAFIFLNEEMKAIGVVDKIIFYFDVFFSIALVCTVFFGVMINSYAVGKYENDNNISYIKSPVKVILLELTVYFLMMLAGVFMLYVVPRYYVETYSQIVYGFVFIGSGLSLFYWSCFCYLRKKD